MRPPGTFPIRGWRMQPHEIEENSEFVAECLCLWDLRHDTKEIASIVFQPENVVESAVRLGRERRRRMEG